MLAIICSTFGLLSPKTFYMYEADLAISDLFFISSSMG
jgi:hypothetical protein